MWGGWREGRGVGSLKGGGVGGENAERMNAIYFCGVPWAATVPGFFVFLTPKIKQMNVLKHTCTHTNLFSDHTHTRGMHVGKQSVHTALRFPKSCISSPSYSYTKGKRRATINFTANSVCKRQTDTFVSLEDCLFRSTLALLSSSP